MGDTHKVDADDQLRLGAALASDLGHVGPVVLTLRMRTSRRRRPCWRRPAVSSAVAALGGLWGVAWRATLGRVAHVLLLRRVASARVDGRQRAVWTAGLLLARRKAAGGRVRVRGRAAEIVLLVHGGQGRRAGVGGLRGQAGGTLGGRRGSLGCGRWVV
jgi:hypothetical protein